MNAKTIILSIISDTDKTKSKTDVVFFARKGHSIVRVLCQLTIRKASSTYKTKEAFEAISGNASEFKMDYKLFIAPRSNIVIGGYYEDNYNDILCFWNDFKSFKI